MSHPFTKIFEKALKKSTVDNNVVLEESLKLRKKGYSKHEIGSVLLKLKKSLIDRNEENLVAVALYEFEELE